jgi:ribA/ribD-fused uncharacterized protein
MASRDVPAEIREFRGRWAFLSNFHRAELVWEGIQYPTSEHAFNAGKTLDMGERAWIAAAPTPREAKQRGRTVALRPWWDAEVRFEVMAEVLNAKFTAHPSRAHALLSTGDALLAEGNTWHDNTWGDCHCRRQACIDPGRNALGVLLMGLRSDLRAAGPEPHHLAHQNPAGEYAPNCPACAEVVHG